jgi:hypothetical protein
MSLIAGSECMAAPMSEMHDTYAGMGVERVKTTN